MLIAGKKLEKSFFFIQALGKHCKIKSSPQLVEIMKS